jgi:hypothetical protein
MESPVHVARKRKKKAADTGKVSERPAEEKHPYKSPLTCARIWTLYLTLRYPEVFV